ncbi:MAG: ABC transporter ATP-binding protein, partial [Clostridiales bacterium]|nr:ABC transporter ATP-binding protein [Clostridiales bacterium]
MNGQEETAPKKPMTKALKDITRYSKKNMVYILVALILAAAGAILGILGPNQLSKITDYITEGIMGSVNLQGIATIGLFLIGLYLVSALFTYIQHFIMSTVTLKQSNKLRRDIFSKINKVPLKYFNTTSHGDVLSRMTNDVDTLGQALSNSLPSIVSAVAQFVSCLIMMFVTEWRMALAATLATVLGFFLMGAIMSRSQKYFIKQQLSLGNLNGYIEEMYSGHDVIRISLANDKVKSRFSKLNYAVYDSNRKSQFISGIMQPLMNLIGNLGYVAVCITGAALAMGGKITFGVIVAFIMYVRLFTSPLTSIAQGMTNVQTAAAAGDRVFS